MEAKSSEIYVSENTSITIKGERLTGKYKGEGNDSCEIKIIDGFEYKELIQPLLDDSSDVDHCVYILNFECKGKTVKGKGKGKKLLFDVLNYIRNQKGPKTYVTLISASKEREGRERKDSDYDELNRYYMSLGFTMLEKSKEYPAFENVGFMYGNIETIMSKCSPEEFKKLPVLPAAAALSSAAAAAARPMESKSHKEVYFSDSDGVPVSEGDDDDVYGYGGGSKHSRKNTRKNKSKNKKSRKRRSLKYINNKRPRGFSQR